VEIFSIFIRTEIAKYAKIVKAAKHQARAANVVATDLLEFRRE